MVPPLVSFLATHPMVKSQHLSSVVAVTGGAAPFGPALIEKFKEKCTPNEIKFREGYSMFQYKTNERKFCKFTNVVKNFGHKLVILNP